jgi:uncharacterized protein with HEPN domain
MKSSRIQLVRMLDSVERIERYTTMRRAPIMDEDMIDDAILRHLDIISDCARQLALNVKRRYKTVLWTRLRGLRGIIHNRLIDTIDRAVLYRMIEDDLPILKLILLAEVPEWYSLQRSDNMSPKPSPFAATLTDNWAESAMPKPRRRRQSHS